MKGAFGHYCDRLDRDERYLTGTATSQSAMADLKLNHTRNVAAKFLADTRAINLERDLVDLLMDIDSRYQEELSRLDMIIKAMGKVIVDE